MWKYIGYSLTTAALTCVGAGRAIADDEKMDAEMAEARSRGAVAFADIKGCNGEGKLGRALLVEKPSDQGIKTVVVTIRVDGLEPGNHAVHIHETAACEPCGAAGGHFDPGPNSNPSPDGNHPFHMGDLVNLKVNKNGRGRLLVNTTRVTLSPGPLSIFDSDGSAIIIHVDEDTFCPEGEAGGCAGGARAACGIIQPF